MILDTRQRKRVLTNGPFLSSNLLPLPRFALSNTVVAYLVVEEKRESTTIQQLVISKQQQLKYYEQI